MVDFMRGEETQMAGLMKLYPELPLPIIAVVLSSHTKYISINVEKKITGSCTTISGQIFDAIKDYTSVGKSIISPDGTEDDDFFEPSVIEAAYDSTLHAGFLRTLMMPRFLEVLLKEPWHIRRQFIDATIVAEDLRAVNDFDLLNLPKKATFVLIGYKRRCKIFKYLLQKFYGITEVKEIFEKDEVDMLSIRGAVTIAEKAGYLK
jgi:2-dehydro-3-deoxygalactonokinase